MGRSINFRLPKKIAVTGGIASGKSTVCHLFEEFGAYVVSADAIVHQLLVPTTHLGKDIIALLGADIVVDETLSREKISQKVFSSPTLLRRIEKLIHPEVQKVIEARYKTASQQSFSLFVAEIPLLFEAGMEKEYDVVIVIHSDLENCRKRSRYDKNEFLCRSQRLIPIQEKMDQADIIISNNGTLDDLRRIVQTTYNSLKENI